MRSLRRPSAPMIVALLALFVALGGPAEAAKLINGSRIKPDSVASKQIKDRSLKLRDLGPGAIRTLTTTPGNSITAPMFGENSVTTRAIAPGAVLTGNVGDNSLTAADLGANSVGPEEIMDNGVGQAQIRANGVGGSEIAPDSVDGGKVADGSLSIRDVARQVGRIEWPVGDLRTYQCESKLVPISGFRINGDFLVLHPTSRWPEDLVYTIRGSTPNNEYVLQACAMKDVLGATYTFNYAILGF